MKTARKPKSEVMILIEIIIGLEDQLRRAKRRRTRLRARARWHMAGLTGGALSVKKAVACECAADRLDSEIFSLGLRLQQTEQHTRRLCTR